MPQINPISANFAPDGFSSGQPRANPGLKFAVASAVEGIGAREQASGGSGARSDISQRSHHQDDYDDGLVHSHGWARSDR